MINDEYVEMKDLPSRVKQQKRRELYRRVKQRASNVSSGVHNAGLFVNRQWKATQPVRQKISKGYHNLEVAYKNKPSMFSGSTGEERSAFGGVSFGTTLFPVNSRHKRTKNHRRVRRSNSMFGFNGGGF